jgi:hypothetical protein
LLCIGVLEMSCYTTTYALCYIIEDKIKQPEKTDIIEITK